jgi:hypothetical protein
MLGALLLDLPPEGQNLGPYRSGPVACFTLTFRSDMGRTNLREIALS